MEKFTDNFPLAQEILTRMVELGKTLSTAESCTSGRIAAALTQVSGASDYFQGGLVAYQDHLKVRYLEVRQEDIDAYDVVSQPVVEQMVRGACRLFHSDYAIASTGYAGTGANGIPSGTIWIGWGSTQEVLSICFTQDEGRELNTVHATTRALECFLRFISN
ncbi:MAG: CinA family protein [Bacteroidaceae bacterium]|nr:CinA family protein [Bacteroidaceae bacterium]